LGTENGQKVEEKRGRNAKEKGEGEEKRNGK
jgi:hypothetical protein